MIPRKIFTVWLNHNPLLPELVERCIASQQNLEGYTHKIITLDEARLIRSRFLDDALASERWVKASDYLRMHYLFIKGGIYLDADVEVIGSFDDLLDTQMFVGLEDNKIFSNAVVGSVAGHWLLGEYLRRLDDNFRGDGDLTFESGVRAFTDLVWVNDKEKLGIKTYSPDYFYPINSETREDVRTENTRTVHHFLNSWK